MKTLNDYLTLEAIATVLAKMRMRRTVRNSERMFADRFFALKKATPKMSAARAYLPPLRQWSRPRKDQRKGRSTSQLQVRSILRTVHGFRQSGRLGETAWGAKLLAFVDDLRGRVAGRDFVFAPPRKAQVPKLSVDGRRETREISIFDELRDSVLLTRAAACLRDGFEPELQRLRCCYSFRRNGKISHAHAVGNLLVWRKAHEGEEVWVSECDIRKFFDNVRHDVVLAAYDRAAARVGGFDPALRDVVVGYLRACRDGASESDAIGIPQGGALSPVLANIVMAEADEEVMRFAGADFFYARYCDDMIIAGTDRARVAQATEAYFAALERLKLPPHPRKDFVYGAGYFEAKTKGPFRWCAAREGEPGKAPWVAFLGNQIRYDGEVRVRKDTVEKHAIKLGRVCGEIVRWVRKGVPLRKGVAAEALYSAFRNRLTAKGVGYLRAGTVPADGICWMAAFPKLTVNRDCLGQMRWLDRWRERLLLALRKELDISPCGRPFGRPYSYYGYLLKLARPGRKNISRIDYSEL